MRSSIFSLIFLGTLHFGATINKINSTIEAFLFDDDHFRVFLRVDEIVQRITISGYKCSLPDAPSFLKDVEVSENATHLLWDRNSPPYTHTITMELNCNNHDRSGVKRRNRRSRREVDEITNSSTTTAGEKLIEFTTPSPGFFKSTEASQQTEQIRTTTANPSSEELTNQRTTQKITNVSHEEVPSTTEINSEFTSTPEMKRESTSTTSIPHIESTTDSIRVNRSWTTKSPILVSESPTEANGVESLHGDENSISRNFTLTIQRIDVDFVQGQELPTLDKALNMTEGLEERQRSRNESQCLIIPKDVLILSDKFVLLAVVVNQTGWPIPGGLVNRYCQLDEWEAVIKFLPEYGRLRIMDGKVFQLQILSVCLAAGVIVFALLAVFLCLRWRLAVRGSKRDTSDGFYVKTFHTKEHHYTTDEDDAYGFPTLRRDGVFYRNPGDSAAQNGRSFVNGGFHDNEDLPPPPPELRSCLINDSHFTEVPLNNLTSDHVRAHRGAQKSPPAPPIRTVSSGYTSGQSTPAVDYHNPQEVMALPHIPKEDYDDDEDENSSYSSPSPPVDSGHKVERQGRFTVRTPL